MLHHFSEILIFRYISAYKFASTCFWKNVSTNARSMHCIVYLFVIYKIILCYQCSYIWYSKILSIYLPIIYLCINEQAVYDILYYITMYNSLIHTIVFTILVLHKQKSRVHYASVNICHICSLHIKKISAELK